MPCNMCGMCCRAVALRYDMNYLRKVSHNNNDAKFIIENWIQITLEEAFKINKHLKKYEKEILDRDMNYFFKCKLLDEKTNLCTIHNERPQICSGFPWYGKEPKNLLFWYSENCGYKKEYDDYLKTIENVQKIESIIKGIDRICRKKGENK